LPLSERSLPVRPSLESYGLEVDQGNAEQAEPAIIVRVEGKFDLEAYISQYSGHTKIARILFIIKRCPELVEEALPMVINELKQGEDTTQYQKVLEMYGPQLESLGLSLDQGWISSLEKQSDVQLGKLENQLNMSKSGVAKEATRVAHTNMGDYWFSRGDISSALKSYTRARDYCSSPELTRKWCLDVIKCHIALEQFHSISSYVAKAENQESAERRGPIETSKLKVCSALAHMHSRGAGSKDHKNYRFAAKAFLALSAELGDNFNTVIAAQDVAVYGGLCALATLERAELTTSVIKNPAFKQFLDKAPEMNQIIMDFKNSQYASMLKHMDDLKPSLSLDIHLARHLDTLIGQIRTRAMVQYFMPYSAVDLRQMATAFDRDVGLLEKELAQLITEGQISARIDSHNKVLRARSANIRTTTFKSALDVGDQFTTETDAMLLRASILRNNLVVAAPKKSQFVAP